MWLSVPGYFQKYSDKLYQIWASAAAMCTPLTTLCGTLSLTEVAHRRWKQKGGLHVPLLLMDLINATALKLCGPEWVFSCVSSGFTVLQLSGDENAVDLWARELRGEWHICACAWAFRHLNANRWFLSVEQAQNTDNDISVEPQPL